MAADVSRGTTQEKESPGGGPPGLSSLGEASPASASPSQGRSSTGTSSVAARVTTTIATMFIQNPARTIWGMVR